MEAIRSANAKVHQALEKWILDVEDQREAEKRAAEEAEMDDDETIPGIPFSKRARVETAVGRMRDTLPDTQPDTQEVESEVEADDHASQESRYQVEGGGDMDWAEQWAQELTEKHVQEHEDIDGRQDAGQVLRRTILEARDTNPAMQPPIPQANPWLTLGSDDLKMLKSDKDLVDALWKWSSLVSSVERTPKADLTITFLPNPPIRSEAQLHQRVAAMGISVYQKGANPTTTPFGVQGGQRGQYSVAVTMCSEPAVRFTIQLQCAKGNLVLKGKRAVFETQVLLTVMPYLGVPVESPRNLLSPSGPQRRRIRRMPHWSRLSKATRSATSFLEQISNAASGFAG